MEFTSAGYLECICGVCIFNLQTDIDFQLLFQSFTDVTGCNLFTGLTGKWRVVDHEVHGQSRFFDLNGW